MNTITSSKVIFAPPAVKRRRLGFSGWASRVLLALMALIIALCGSGAIWQVVAEARDKAVYPAPGQLVDVGGYRMHIHCMGEGRPTVILDHVGAGNSAQWGLVQPEIASTARVCAYDRAGFGWSDAGPEPRDAQQNVSELHTLLTNAQIPPPYVLVGHSFGGNVARLYAAQYPHDIAGMVLVDPGKLPDAPGVSSAIKAQWQAEDRFIVQAAPVLARLGVFRLGAALNSVPGHGDLRTEQGQAFDALNLSTTFWDTVNRQDQASHATSAEVLQAGHDYGALPLIVLSATEPADASRQAWTHLNADVAGYSSHGIHRIIAGATHMGLAYAREHSQATVDAIRDVIVASRTGQHLQQ